MSNVPWHMTQGTPVAGAGTEYCAWWLPHKQALIACACTACLCKYSHLQHAEERSVSNRLEHSSCVCYKATSTCHAGNFTIDRLHTSTFPL